MKKIACLDKETIYRYTLGANLGLRKRASAVPDAQPQHGGREQRRSNYHAL